MKIVSDNAAKAVETAIRALYKQGRRSVDAGGYCRYRGYGGTKCAVGMLIPDEDYKSDFELGTSLHIEDPVGEYLQQKYGCNGADIGFLRVCQSSLHDRILAFTDSAGFRATVIREAKLIARSFSLDGTFIEQLDVPTDKSLMDPKGT